MFKDTQKILKCPACGMNMKKIRIADLGFVIDICLDGCGGIIFDNQELNRVLESKENFDKIIRYMQDKSFDSVDTKEVRICSVCDTPMVKLGGKNINSVEYDKCNNCGAVFLDYGELERVEFN